MKDKVQKMTTFFVDESGDPIFYDRHGNLSVGKEGCSKILILGFIKTETPETLRKTMYAARAEVMADKYLHGIPSFSNSCKFFHAKDDCPEIRERIFKSMFNLPFKAQFFVGRKIESIFRKKHKSDGNLFYDDLISKLFENQLHTSEKNIVYFATRGNRARQEPLQRAIQAAVDRFEKKWGKKMDAEIEVYAQTPVGKPCLQIIDYMNWAVYRAFTKGEMRYFDFMREKISLVVDLYDAVHYPNTYYTKKNPLHTNKISPM